MAEEREFDFASDEEIDTESEIVNVGQLLAPEEQLCVYCKIAELQSSLNTR